MKRLPKLDGLWTVVCCTGEGLAIEKKDGKYIFTDNEKRFFSINCIELRFLSWLIRRINLAKDSIKIFEEIK